MSFNELFNSYWFTVSYSGIPWWTGETAIVWPPDAKSWLIGKDPDAGKDWRQEEKAMTEDKIVR